MVCEHLFCYARAFYVMCVFIGARCEYWELAPPACMREAGDVVDDGGVGRRRDDGMWHEAGYADSRRHAGTSVGRVEDREIQLKSSKRWGARGQQGRRAGAEIGCTWAGMCLCMK